jgi:EAL domain-containing protein (putative c-di-GMP-specific phosphodiesterase class I)
MWAEENANFVTTALLDDWVLSGRPAGGDEIRCFMLRPLPFQVGRRPGLSLMLPANTVSGIHAEFFLVGSKLCLRDLGSTNGTFVNGDRLTEVRELHDNDVVQFSDLPFRLTRNPIADLSHTRTKNAVDQALAIVQFDRLITGRGVIPHYQPIVELATGRIVAFEVLARSRLVGLESPALMFSAAAQLGLSADLSEMLRLIAVEDSYRLQDVTHLFLNTHPCELDTGMLLHSCEELRRISPRQPLTIEMHEAAMTNVDEMITLRNGLEQLDISLAFDDFGAGQARILEIAAVRPHYVKFDRCMIHDLHTDPSRRRVVARLVQMIQEVGIIPLAECVESIEEAQACIDAGFVLSQGYLHGKPMPAVHYINIQNHQASPGRA